jgi:hypothetical protein
LEAAQSGVDPDRPLRLTAALGIRGAVRGKAWKTTNAAYLMTSGAGQKTYHSDGQALVFQFCIVLTLLSNRNSG